jgi:hypothetical protein
MQSLEQYEKSDNEYLDRLWNFRNELLGIQEKSQSEYDKTIVIVSSGGLAATIGFFDKLPDGTPSTLIFISWAFWAISLIAVITSHAGSVHSTKKIVSKLDSWLEFRTSDEFNSPRSMWKKIIIICNHAAYWLLCLGILFCGIAVGIGILSPKNKKYEQQQTIERAEGIHSATTPTETEHIEGIRRKIPNNGRTSDTESPTKTEKVIIEKVVDPASSSETPHPPASAPIDLQK